MHAPMDAEMVLNIATPDICIFTNLAPSILSHTDKSDQYNKTFSYLLRRLPKDTILITNSDDPHLEELAQFFQTKSCATDKALQAVGSYRKFRIRTGARIQHRVRRRDFSIKIKEFGLHHAYIAAAAFALSSELKLDLKKFSGNFAINKSICKVRIDIRTIYHIGSQGEALSLFYRIHFCGLNFNRRFLTESLN